MKILITGGSGFLGRNLIGRLAREGHELSCLDRYAAPFLGAFGVKAFQGDIFEKMLVKEAVSGADVVIHMACTVIPKTSNDDPHFDVVSNVGGAIRLLDAAVANKVKRFVFLSSGGTIYGPPRSVPIPEDHPTDPDCSYGITKLAVEKYLHLYNKLHGLSTCALRFANPYGEHQRYVSAQGAIPVFCYRALKGEPIDIWGDGSVRRDFIYVGDAIEAIVAALHMPEATGAINIGCGKSASINEVLEIIEAAIGRPVRRNYLPGRDFDVPNNVLDITRARNLLGWEPVVGLEEGIGRTLEWIGDEMKGGRR